MSRRAFCAAPAWPGARVALFLLLLFGCGPQEEPGLVARVFDGPITAEQYTTFVSGLPAGLRSQKAGLDGRLEELQSLIDRELLLHEARHNGLDQDRDFQRKLRHLHDQAVLRSLHQVQVTDSVRLSEAEARRYFHATDRDREVRLAFANLPTRDEAEAIARQVHAGRSFAAAAGSRLQQGGGRFYNRDTIHPRLREAAFALRPGQVSPPIPYKPGFILVQLVEQRAANFALYRTMVNRHALADQVQAREREVAGLLERRYAPVVDAAALARLATAAAAAPTPDAIDTGIVVCTFQGGQVSSGQVVDEAVTRGQVAALADAAQLDGLVRRGVLPQALQLAEAERLGVGDQTLQTPQEVDRLLLDELVLRQVKAGIRISEQEARTYFAAHQDAFSPTFAEVQEILVATREEAQEIVERVQQDPMLDVGALAEERTLRPQGKQTGGRFHFHMYEKPVYGNLVDVALAAPLNEMQGPVEVDGGFSVFWVLRREQRPVSFDDARVQFAVRNILTKMQQNERFDALVARLRGQYAHDVRLYRRNLRALRFPAAPLPAPAADSA